MFHAWVDYRDGNGDIYLTRISSSGAVAAGWPLDGVPVCTAPGEQVDLEIYPDGSGGVIVIWLDGRDDLANRVTYAQRITPLGVAQWSANGVRVLPSSWTIEDPEFTPDGTGGLLVVWTGTGGPDRDIYALRIDGTGAVASGWTATGALVCGLAEDQVAPTVAADGTGGAIVAWEDYRNGQDARIFAQRLHGERCGGVGGGRHPGRAQPGEPVRAGGLPRRRRRRDRVLGRQRPVRQETIIGQRVEQHGASAWPAGGVDVGGGGIVSLTEIRALPDGARAGSWWRRDRVGEQELRAQRAGSSGAKLWGTHGHEHRDIGCSATGTSAT